MVHLDMVFQKRTAAEFSITNKLHYHVRYIIFIFFKLSKIWEISEVGRLIVIFVYCVLMLKCYNIIRKLKQCIIGQS